MTRAESTLALIKCASAEEKMGWMKWYRQAPKETSPMRAWCDDCIVGGQFQLNAIKEGTCIKPSRLL